VFAFNVTTSDSDEVASGPGRPRTIFVSMINKTSAPALLEQLQLALVRRDVRSGFYLLDSALAKPLKLDFRSPYAVSLFLSVAQWVDLGYRDLDLLDNLAADLPNLDRGQLSMLEFLKLRIHAGLE